ncbi:helix-turn-helix domain-containing protein [Chitinophaga nivalis]|uniref:AraC family transcriptional regulator n=1 Tax=Chitinophaga nivalis TaxID=2991709 RepID=A0ABT3IMT9_9BACT|nr:AraC family transcriptional regulator [Chitinophaga nivalis]MCW3465025.1 AraC family transcriptional regulator [Chitinophaga nivalis]MCW3485283.1 AraC family transcriptional regulator [Chitinophaga nivalis]
MTTQVIKVKNPYLQAFIQFFIFFKGDVPQAINYVTFPNNNLCLALYKHNDVVYNNTPLLNHCEILPGHKTYTSRLYGFHEMPFQVTVKAPIDQVCIIFQPAALRMFTREAYKELLESDQVFHTIFPAARHFPELLFQEPKPAARAALLETLLLKNIQQHYLPGRMQTALDIIDQGIQHKINVTTIAREMGINNATLYRLFSDHLGQNPIAFLKTLRFRKALETLRHSQPASLTGVAYTHHYFDQAHFIKDFKHLSGATPKQLQKNLAIQQDTLVWIYKEA